MGKLFGTDGIRGIANKELTCEMAMNIGRSVVAVLTGMNHAHPMILVGKDTRISSDMLEAALISGICSAGGDAVRLNEISTPAVAYLVQHYQADAGIMISASHNPAKFNGIKIFDDQGYKVDDTFEENVESYLFEERHYEHQNLNDIGTVSTAKDAYARYIIHLADAAESTFDGLKIAIDCANGSACKTAGHLFSAFSAQFTILNDHPDGYNINRECGSTDPKALSEFVVNNHMDIGFAFDGDADRCIVVDENGNPVDGDRLLAIFAKYMKEKKKLSKSTAVVTVLTNIGFSIFAKEHGINVSTTNVGDKNIVDKLKNERLNLGGEQSGHIIFSDFATTGDGQLTAILLLNILYSQKEKMSKLSAVMKSYPQVVLNVNVENAIKHTILDNKNIQSAILSAKNELGDDGRILVRASGTEPVIRVMLEGQDKSMLMRLAENVSDEIQSLAV